MQLVIGLEVHCELKTKTKNFSSAINSYSSLPNENVSPVDLGLPGILPIINKQGVKNAIKMALAFNCEIPAELTFERKNYFYPDLPKGYQITQLYHPIGEHGFVMIHSDKDKKIIIRDTHLEEDTASLDHFTNYSLIDYNRCGVPLLETVTDPCIESADDAILFLETLRSMFLYCNTSEARADQGQIRCDVNINLKDDNGNYITPKVEIKNINSFNNVYNAIICEEKRQKEYVKQGKAKELIQETRRYSEDDMCTYPMRTKEDVVDYKFFTEPNIPPIKLTNDFITSIKQEIPMLQFDRVNKYINEYHLSRRDATILVKDKNIADYFEKTAELNNNYQSIANWLITRILGYINKENIAINNLPFTPDKLNDLIKLIDNKEISSQQAKDILIKCLEENKSPKEVVKASNITQITDDQALRSIINKVLDNNNDNIIKYKNGRTNLLDFFVGMVMKETKGKASPNITSEILKEELERR